MSSVMTSYATPATPTATATSTTASSSMNAPATPQTRSRMPSAPPPTPSSDTKQQATPKSSNLHSLLESSITAHMEDFSSITGINNRSLGTSHYGNSSGITFPNLTEGGGEGEEEFRSRSNTIGSVDFDFDLGLFGAVGGAASDTVAVTAAIGNGGAGQQHNMDTNVDRDQLQNLLRQQQIVTSNVGHLSGNESGVSASRSVINSMGMGMALTAPTPLPTPSFLNHNLYVGKQRSEASTAISTAARKNHRHLCYQPPPNPLLLSSSVQSRTPSLSSSHGSGGSGFVKDIMNSSPNMNATGLNLNMTGEGYCSQAEFLDKDQSQEKNSGNEQTSASAACSSLAHAGMIAHTPPSNFGSSYEASHFGKRPRSGSLSERLRSASDLESRGMIDREQRNMLKDLILTSKDDVELQDALDKYERGDTSQLDSMIRSGTVFERYKTDLDLLDDLDLDFLSFNNDVSGDGNNRTDPDDTGVSEGITDEMNMAHAQLTDGSCPPFARSQTIPLPSRADQQNDFSAGMSHLLGNFYVPSMAISAPQNIAATTTAFDDDDGIGDLDFNGDYSVGLENGEDEELANSFKSLLADGSSRPSFGQMPSCASNPSCRGGMPSSFDLQRSRADSLQLSALLGEARLTSDELGQWTEGMKSGLSVHSNRKARDLDSHVVGGIYLLNTDGGRQATWRKEKSPALGRRKSTSAINRESAVLERKRVRQLKKSQKEREKGEGKAKGEKMRQHSSSSPRARRLDIALKNNLTSDEGEDDNVREVPSGLGLPRSRSDPNLSYRTGNDGLLHVDRPDGWVGAYSPDSRKIRIERFAAKRNSRVWVKTVKYDVRKNFADSRFRVKGRFVKKEDEQLMRDLMGLT